MTIFPFPGSFWTPPRIRGGCTGWCLLKNWMGLSKISIFTRFSFIVPCQIMWNGVQTRGIQRVYPKFPQTSWENPNEAVDLGSIRACIQDMLPIETQPPGRKRDSFPGKETPNWWTLHIFPSPTSSKTKMETLHLFRQLLSKLGTLHCQDYQRIMWWRATIL